mmetsp:Transcript_13868/g.43321  ORF Transcript_13868/g.43321 Transcript_13868/m.43321 type:complete len:207 (+) Transcript_13868:812-1432(+)
MPRSVIRRSRSCTAHAQLGTRARAPWQRALRAAQRAGQDEAGFRKGACARPAVRGGGDGGGEPERGRAQLPGRDRAAAASAAQAAPRRDPFQAWRHARAQARLHAGARALPPRARAQRIAQVGNGWARARGRNDSCGPAGRRAGRCAARRCGEWPARRREWRDLSTFLSLSAGDVFKGEVDGTWPAPSARMSSPGSARAARRRPPV